MKVKKMSMILTTVMAIVVMSSLSARADAWYNCSIYYVGSTSNSMLVSLTDLDTTPDFTQNWFLLSGANANQMLATLLTALSIGKNVVVNVSATSAFAELFAVYVIP